jgi:hypothetical protein
MALTKAKILEANDIKLKELDMSQEWGGTVYIRTITGTERDQFEDSYAEQKMRGFRVRFLVLTLCDDKGDRLFSDGDAELLGKKSSASINKAFDAAWSHNAFTPEAVNELGNDSPGDQNASST